MFYSNVKKLVELPASPLGFLKNFCRREDKTEFDQDDSFSRGSPGRRSLREQKSESFGIRISLDKNNLPVFKCVGRDRSGQIFLVSLSRVLSYFHREFSVRMEIVKIFQLKLKFVLSQQNCAF